MTVFAAIAAASMFTSTNVSSENAAGIASSSELAASAERPYAGAALLRPNYVHYADNLRHWDKPTVTVYVNPSLNDNKSREQTVELVSRGIDLWNQKLSSAIRLKAVSTPGADVTVSVVTPGTLAGGAIGRTDVTFRMEDQVLTHALVRINERLPQAEMVQVTAHELGHALGIQGHSPDKHDLMYPYAHLPAEITDRDFNTMAVSYNVSPVALTASARPANGTTDTDDAAELSAR
jgi:hypothetical protein